MGGRVRSFPGAGSWVVFATVLSGGMALLLSRQIAWPPLIRLAPFGRELQIGHASPHGPIAFSLLLLFAIWILLTDRVQV